MQIQKIYPTMGKSVYFGRKLTKDEEQDYKNNAIKPALDYLGVKELAMIIHGTSYPDSGSNDIGVGSPYGKVAAQLIPFEILHGFNSNQLGPIGELNSVTDYSPYQSSIGAKNYLFIDLEKLSTETYANILDKEDVKNVVNPKFSKNEDNYALSDFPEAFANYNYLISKANRNFHNKLNQKDANALKLYTEFKNYLKKNPQIADYGIFSLLVQTYGTDDYTKWKDIDKNLVKGVQSGDPSSLERREQIIKRSKNKYEEYLLGQFILNKQIHENTALREKVGFKYISDMLVGVSPADEWAHQDVFLKEYRIGCPYGGPDGGLQKWDLPVLDPKKLFNKNGSLGEGGVYLKSKLEDALTNFDNVRIDHALGLVDPYIYSKDGQRANNISFMPDIDPNGNYKKILDKIILPTLKEHGLDKNSPVWEDLVTETPVFNKIYYEEHQIPGITQLEYKKAEDYQNTHNWGLIGSHDSDPANLMIKKDWVRQNEAWNPMYLAGVLNAAHDSSEYCDKIHNDDSERVKAKFAELFMMCKKIQITFADFFGIEKTYNQGGNDKNPNNWKLRLSKNYEDEYYKNLSSNHPTAINMPEILKMAVLGKQDMDIATKKENLEYSAENIDNIVQNLEKYENILKE